VTHCAFEFSVQTCSCFDSVTATTSQCKMACIDDSGCILQLISKIKKRWYLQDTAILSVCCYRCHWLDQPFETEGTK